MHNFDDILSQNYVVNEKCIICKKCIIVCPQKCIDYEEQKAYIKPKHCLRREACKEICPVQAIEIK